jgi:hypothetical protein
VWRLLVKPSGQGLLSSSCIHALKRKLLALVLVCPCFSQQRIEFLSVVPDVKGPENLRPSNSAEQNALMVPLQHRPGPRMSLCGSSFTIDLRRMDEYERPYHSATGKTRGSGIDTA